MDKFSYVHHYNTKRWDLPEKGSLVLPADSGIDLKKQSGNEDDSINLLIGAWYSGNFPDITRHWYFSRWISDERTHAEFFGGIKNDPHENSQGVMRSSYEKRRKTMRFYEKLLKNRLDVWGVLALDEALTTREYAEISKRLKKYPIGKYFEYLARDESRHCQGAIFALIEEARAQGMNGESLGVFLHHKHTEVMSGLEKLGLLGQTFAGDQDFGSTGERSKIIHPVIERISAKMKTTLL